MCDAFSFSKSKSKNLKNPENLTEREEVAGQYFAATLAKLHLQGEHEAYRARRKAVDERFSRTFRENYLRVYIAMQTEAFMKMSMAKVDKILEISHGLESKHNLLNKLKENQIGFFTYEKLLDRAYCERYYESDDEDVEKSYEQQTKKESNDDCCEGEICQNEECLQTAETLAQLKQRERELRLELQILEEQNKRMKGTGLQKRLATKKEELKEERKRKEAHERAKSQEWTVPDWVLNEDKKRHQKRSNQSKKGQKEKKPKTQGVKTRNVPKKEENVKAKGTSKTNPKVADKNKDKTPALLTKNQLKEEKPPVVADAATHRKHISEDIKQKSAGSAVSKDSELHPFEKSCNKENHPPPVIEPKSSKTNENDIENAELPQTEPQKYTELDSASRLAAVLRRTPN